jgi:chorismate synthase
LLHKLNQSSFPLLNEERYSEMEREITTAKEERDSVGGIIECAACGIPKGLGEPFFDSVESVISSLMFSIPAVKGVSFGSGFGFAAMRGSVANDAIRIKNGEIMTETNHNAGVNGGISNGMPIVCKVAFKPTPSIGQEQQTINLETMQNDTIAIHGRHDPCIVPRAVVVTEAVLALALLDLWEVYGQ